MHYSNVIIYVLCTVYISCNEAKKVLSIKSIETLCTEDVFNIKLNFDNLFKGIIYAKNFRDNDLCKSNISDFKDSFNISLSLNTKYCGIKSIIDLALNKVYSLNIIIQHDRKLQQIYDLEKMISCTPNSKTYTDTAQLNDAVHSMLIKRTTKRRTGRLLHDNNNKADKILTVRKVWMEFESNHTNNKKNIKVGDLVKIKINAIFPITYDWKVANCEASDGTENISQLLLDLKGCPVDVTIMPQLKKINVNYDDVLFDNSQKIPLKHQQAFAEFIAFKFPDRNTLNIVCHLEICNLKCSNINCTDNQRQPKFDKDVIDDIEIFNSVDILAPGIEIERFLAKKTSSDMESKSEDSTSQQICISSIKLAITFSGLGFFFLSAIIISVLCLLTSKKYSNRSSIFTRSTIFSNSSSNNSNSFSNVNSNTDISQKFVRQFLPNSSRSSSKWSYGRIF